MKRLAALLVLLASGTASASFCGGYTYQRTLTINATQVSTQTLNYQNFPVLISTNEVTFSTTTGSGGHLSTGYDMIISSDSSCQFLVNWDTETVQNVGVSTTNIWARMDFSSSTNRTYYLTYGNPAITTYQGISTATWDSNYTAVWHFGTGNTTINSVVNGATVTYTGAPVASTGIVDGALTYNGTNQHGDVNMPIAYSSITVEAWGNFTNLSNTNPRIVSNSHTDTDGHGFQLGWNDPGNFEYMDVGTGTGLEANLSVTMSTGSWYHFVGEYDGTNIILYLNAVNKSVHAQSGSIIASGFNVGIGWNPSYGSSLVPGTIDEVRISSGIARSQGWIQTEYNNITAPSTFLTIGAETTNNTVVPQGDFLINGGKVYLNGVKVSIQ